MPLERLDFGLNRWKISNYLYLLIIWRKTVSHFWFKCSRLFTIHLIALVCKAYLSFDERDTTSRQTQVCNFHERTGYPHILVVGAGFGGLQFIHDLKGANVRITLVDQRNHHLFQPLLYQVATTILATSEIAWPIRHLFRDRKDVSTLLGTVVGVDTAAQKVRLENGEEIAYDTLVLATGARHAYFGNDRWEKVAPGLKALEDATTIRRRLLLAFERAERETDPAKQQALLTFSVVGGADRRGIGGHYCRTGQADHVAGIPQYRYAAGTHSAR